MFDFHAQCQVQIQLFSLGASMHACVHAFICECVHAKLNSIMQEIMPVRTTLCDIHLSASAQKVVTWAEPL